MGWGNPFKKIRKAAVKALPKPARKVVKKEAAVLRNPAKKLVPNKIRKSSIYKNVARPVIKMTAAVAAGVVTGGTSWGVMLAAGATGAALGGLDNKGFSIKKHVLAPALAGYAVGSIPSGGWSGISTPSLSTVNSGVGLAAKVKGNLDKNKARKTQLAQTKASAIEDAKLDAEIARLEAKQESNLPVESKAKSNLSLIAAGAGAGLFVAGPVGAIGGAVIAATVKK